MKGKKIGISITIDKSLWYRAKIVAAQDGRTLSSYINKLLLKDLEGLFETDEDSEPDDDWEGEEEENE